MTQIVDGLQVRDVALADPEGIDEGSGVDALRSNKKVRMSSRATPIHFAQITETLAWADASTAWFVCQSNVSAGTSAAAMPPHAAAAIFDGPRTGLAWGVKHNNSTAIRVEGGYRLTGTWSFASGGRHTRWLGAHSAVRNPDGTKHIRRRQRANRGG